MASITVKNSAGKDSGSLDLDDDMFGVQPNVPLMHQVVTAQLAARRSRHTEHQDPGRGPWWRQEAVQAEGHR